MDRLCPLLALTADGRTVVEGVDRGHACHALPEPMPLERQLQAQLCLTPRHDRCERYAQHVSRQGGIPGRTPVAGGLVSTRLVLAPEPAWRGFAGRARRGRPARAALAIGAAIAAGTVAVAAAAGTGVAGGLSFLDTPQPSPSSFGEGTRAAVPSQSPPAPTTTPTPSATASPTPTATSPATASATPAATPSPTPPPTTAPTPPPVQTYVVQEGDTLASIADRFGTSVSALQAANDIDDPDEIVIGDTLVIP